MTIHFRGELTRKVEYAWNFIQAFNSICNTYVHACCTNKLFWYWDATFTSVCFSTVLKVLPAYSPTVMGCKPPNFWLELVYLFNSSLNSTKPCLIYFAPTCRIVHCHCPLSIQILLAIPHVTLSFLLVSLPNFVPYFNVNHVTLHNTSFFGLKNWHGLLMTKSPYIVVTQSANLNWIKERVDKPLFLSFILCLEWKPFSCSFLHMHGALFCISLMWWQLFYQWWNKIEANFVLSKTCSQICQVAPGDVVELSGVFLPIPYTGFRAMRAGLVADTYLEAMSVSHFKKKYEE